LLHRVLLFLTQPFTHSTRPLWVITRCRSILKKHSLGKQQGSVADLFAKPAAHRTNLELKGCHMMITMTAPHLFLARTSGAIEVIG
jgi:hypothetical protein